MACLDEDEGKGESGGLGVNNARHLQHLEWAVRVAPDQRPECGLLPHQLLCHQATHHRQRGQAFLDQNLTQACTSKDQSLANHLDVGALLLDAGSEALLLVAPAVQGQLRPRGQALPEDLLAFPRDDVHRHQHIQRVIHPPPNILLIKLTAPCIYNL